MERKPIVITHVSTSYFSVARFSGGAIIQGEPYTYCPHRDILIRNDWVKFYHRLHWEEFIDAVKTGVKPANKKTSKTKNQDNKYITPSLFD